MMCDSLILRAKLAKNTHRPRGRQACCGAIKVMEFQRLKNFAICEWTHSARCLTLPGPVAGGGRARLRRYRGQTSAGFPMTELRTRFAADLKVAMKAKERCRVATLRLILATLKDRDIAARSDGNDDGIDSGRILEMLDKMVRQRRDSIALYEQAGRDELARQEAEEISIIEGYMPKALDEAETVAAVQTTLDELEAGSVKDMGRVMASLKSTYAGRMDFAKASALVKETLAGGA
jgi:uncharacterized protein